ncbi:uncharacterized protein LOC133186986 [Saccostrea echinata]|uniref:uncharacterized protein LOC133186986 n=1 Tax=Saccostrea echinata TaxID=191078 RepID=UPI002A817C42|nr:uncharacterized protein LOC133186986 [Saccostrea echinata]
MAFSLDTCTADEKFTNYITLVVALKYTQEGLQDLVKKAMDDSNSSNNVKVKTKIQKFMENTLQTECGECKTMDFTFPWKSDIYFDYFIKARRHFVGREWLIEDIAYNLLNTDERGVLLAAEIGFGKTALVSHISCSSTKLSPAFPIYKNLIGIHLCSYDFESTMIPGIFVCNMAVSLAHVLPEFGNIIQTDSMANEYLFSRKCIKEPYGCFDFGILNPHRRIKLEFNKLIFIIDALDECIEIGSGNIFSLLSERVHLLPANLKFLFTSRNISHIRDNLPPGMLVYHNPLFWKKKLEDIKKFIKRRLDNTTVNEQIENLLSSSDLDKNASHGSIKF